MVVASMPRQAPHGSDELAAADDAPRSEHNGTVPVLHATNPEMPFQQELEASVAEFEESLSKDSRVSVKKDDGEA